MSAAVFDRAALEALFKPRSIALIGATERSLWSNAAFGNLDRFGFEGDLHLVNPKGGTIYGRAAVRSISEIEGDIDLALIMTPAAALGATLDEIAGRAKSAVILSSGFAETGTEGRATQDALSERARAGGVTLLGPNCLGFINYADRIPVWTAFRRRQRETGSLAIVSQSGAVANSIAEFCFRQSVPLSYLVSTGNEAGVDVASVVRYLADEDNTQAVALFMESARNGAAFMEGARYLASKGKPLVVLKVGASEISAKAAQAHTGSLVGDDRVFDAVCTAFDIVRVHAVEDLVFTADLLSRMPRVAGDGVGFVAPSGGMCEVAADRFEAEGIALPEFSDATKSALKAATADYSSPHNPLDITGAALLDLTMFTKTLAIAGADPTVDVLACLLDGPEAESDHPLMREAMGAIGKGFAEAGKPGVVFTNLANNMSAVGRAVEKASGLVYSSAGLDRGVTALAGACRWWRRAKRAVDQYGPSVALASARPRAERDVLDALASYGCPAIPGRVVKTAAEAAEAAREMGGPLVLKVASAQIAHKTEIGGVALNVAADRAASEFEALMARVHEAAPDAKIDGVIVSPMRERGVDLFVGVLRDPQWGPVISVGFGGVLVEVLDDTALRVLPVGEDDVVAMLGELRGRRLLDGYRGAPSVDVRAVARAVQAIGNAALAFGPELVSLEVNPLWARGDQVEALDGLAVWEGP